MVSRSTRYRISLGGLVLAGLLSLAFGVAAGALSFLLVGATIAVGGVLSLVGGRRFVGPTMLAVAAVTTLVAVAESYANGLTSHAVAFGLAAVVAGYRGRQYWRAVNAR